MDHSKIDTASTYINNLLLARGLLRDGKPIEFAKLSRNAPAAREDDSKESKRHARAPTTAAAEIINLVHDLVLRRDRDQEQHESLALTLRALRAEKSRETSEINRLKEQNQDLRRQVALHESTTRAAETAARSAESSARILRDESSRIKGTLSQVRTQCANDIRKRDMEISKLKTHLAARQRGNKGALVGASITINPGSIGRAHGGSSAGPERGGSPNLEATDYNLKQETTDFLTQLSQSLSEENDSLISLIRSTLGTLKDLLGLPHNQPLKQSLADSSLGHSAKQEDDLVQCPPTSYQTLAMDLEGVLGSLTDLLTNPSFAPIEEVHAREDEIHRLREGWEKMECRWHEAITLMQGWKKRMLNGGGNIDVEELKNGLRLGDGLDSPSRRLPQIMEDDDAPDDLEDDSDFSEHDEEPNVDDLPEVEDEIIPVSEKPIFDGTLADSDQQPLDRHLQELDSNVNKSTASQAKQAMEEHAKENRSLPKSTHVATQDSSPLPPMPTLRQTVTVRNPSATAQTHANSKSQSRKPSANSSRLPKKPIPKAAPEAPLSVDEKLRLAESEARHVSSSPLNSRSRQRKVEGTKDGHITAVENGLAESSVLDIPKETEQQKKRPVKRSRISGRPRRRKSTLSPEELEDLLGN